MAGRPRDAVLLTEDERSTLLAWTRSRTCAQATALRAQIVLACADEPTNTAVAEQLGISRDMVGKWRARFLAERLDGLAEQPRPGRPPAADDDTVAHVLVRTLTPPPRGGRHAWSTRSMARETGLSQSTISRIWRSYHIQPGARVTAGPRRSWSLPGHVEEIVGLFVAPPICVLAVTARTRSNGTARTGATTVGGRLFGQDSDVPHVLAVVGAFAELRGSQCAPNDVPRTNHAALREFLAQVGSASDAGTTVHLLAYGVPTTARGFAERSAALRRLRWYHAPSPSDWIDETRRLLAADAQLVQPPAPDPHRLRGALLTWSSTWTAAAAPFTRIAAPRRSYDRSAICGPDSDSNAPDTRAAERPAAPEVTSADAPPGAPVTTDPVIGVLREAVLTGDYRPGDRVREAPLAARLDVSRRIVRAGLRALADEGMLDLLPSGATAIPAITATDVLDLYALRASLGALLIRRVAMLGPEYLASTAAALAEVRAARDGDHALMREVDLRFQDALARTADLPQAARTFERLTARLRMFVNVLDMDYTQACATITNEDTAVFDAVRNADGNEAARLWRVKIERCVRYMIAQLPEADAAPHLWTSLAGTPRLRREALRNAAH